MANASKNVKNSIIYDLASPVAKNIGETLSSIWDIIFGGIDFYAERKNFERSQNLEKFKDKIILEVNSIPEENLIEPSLEIIGPSIESSKYYFEEETLRDMFAKLIAASMNKEKVDLIHPSFPSIIQNLSPKDAEFLKFISDQETFPYCHLRFQKRTSENMTTFFTSINEGTTISNYLVDMSYPDDLLYDFNPTIDNLIRLRLIEVRSDLHFIDYKRYINFINNPIYLINQNYYFSNPEIYNNEVTLIKGIINITAFGRRFISATV